MEESNEKINAEPDEFVEPLDESYEDLLLKDANAEEGEFEEMKNLMTMSRQAKNANLLLSA